MGYDVEKRDQAATGSFRDSFAEIFDEQFPRLYRVLQRASGEPELAADLVQEAFVRLYERGTLPESPASWLVAVAMNLLRNSRSMGRRRIELLTSERARGSLGDPEPSPLESTSGAETRARVRATLGALTERDRDLLLLRAEGYSYREIASALALNEASVGTLLARARRSFRDAYGGGFHAP